MSKDFLIKCGAFVEAKEYVDQLQLRDRVDRAAYTALQFPTPRNIDLAVDLAWRHSDELDRLYKPAPDQEEQYLADFALARLEAIKGNLGIYQTPDLNDYE
jgi:hypothetical protein